MNHVTRAPAATAAIFGASVGGARVWERLATREDVEVIAFVDNDERRHAEPFFGLPVIAPAAVDPTRVDVVVIGSLHADAMRRQLIDLGFPAARIRTVETLLASAGDVWDSHRVPVIVAGQVRPTVINLQANDICNARCVMCNIWERRRGQEVSPSGLGALLADPYFSEVEHVGITGGEPTLRRDLTELYAVLPDVLPRLTGASFITHGMDRERAVAAYTAVADTYRSRGLAFHGMVSIDGVGQLHDRIRGRAHAFDRATGTLFALKDAGIETTACCTIVRSNVWGLWDLLEWGRGRVHIRFRVAEFINRLGNSGRSAEIRAFDAAERAELISFFETLSREYEPDPSVRKTYASIVSILSGGERLIGCPYQSGRALNIDCRGQFAVCAPKGTPHALGPSPALAVADARQERASIVQTHCSSCIHDYHDDWRPDVASTLAVAEVVQSRLSMEGM